MKEARNVALSPVAVPVECLAQEPVEDWRNLTLAEKCARHLRAAEAAEREADACSDPQARRHALNNALQHRYAIDDLEEMHGTPA